MNEFTRSGDFESFYAGMFKSGTFFKLVRMDCEGML